MPFYWNPSTWHFLSVSFLTVQCFGVFSIRVVWRAVLAINTALRTHPIFMLLWFQSLPKWRTCLLTASDVGTSEALPDLLPVVLLIHLISWRFIFKPKKGQSSQCLSWPWTSSNQMESVVSTLDWQLRRSYISLLIAWVSIFRVMRQMTYTITRFGAYETLKKQMPPGSNNSFVQKCALAAFAGACGGLVSEL